MNKIKSLLLKASLPVLVGLSYVGSVAKAVYTPDDIDTAIGVGVTSIYDRIMYFFTENLPTIFLLVGGILALFFGIKLMRRVLGGR